METYTITEEQLTDLQGKVLQLAREYWMWGSAAGSKGNIKAVKKMAEDSEDDVFKCFDDIRSKQNIP